MQSIVRKVIFRAVLLYFHIKDTVKILFARWLHINCSYPLVMMNVHEPGTTAGQDAILIIHELAAAADESCSVIGQWFVYFSQW